MPLRPLDRSALISVDDIAQQRDDELLVLVEPDGRLELAQSDRGELALWAYSDMQLLAESCGTAQPWTRATPADLAAFGHTVDPPVVIALDVWHPEGARYPEPDVFEDLEPLNELDESAWAPPTGDVCVWVPTRRTVQIGDQIAQVELHRDQSGELVLPIYTSRDQVRACCGPYQAAAAISEHDVAEVAREIGVANVVFDVPLSDQARHTAPVTDWTRHNYFDLDQEGA